MTLLLLRIICVVAGMDTRKLFFPTTARNENSDVQYDTNDADYKQCIS